MDAMNWHYILPFQFLCWMLTFFYKYKGSPYVSVIIFDFVLLINETVISNHITCHMYLLEALNARHVCRVILCCLFIVPMWQVCLLCINIVHMYIYWKVIKFVYIYIYIHIWPFVFVCVDDNRSIVRLIV